MCYGRVSFEIVLRSTRKIKEKDGPLEVELINFETNLSRCRSFTGREGFGSGQTSGQPMSGGQNPGHLGDGRVG